MKSLTSAHVGAFANALYETFTTVDELDRLLHSAPIEKQFDDLTSREISRKRNAWDICSQAVDEGWALALLDVALKDSPDSPTLRALMRSLPEADETAGDALKARDDRPSLLCGRATQWNEVCQSALAKRHQVMVVVGGVGQDPLHFRERIHTWLSLDPRRSMVVVQWLTRPARREAYLEELAHALQTDPEHVTEKIAERTMGQNLVLLHDCVNVRFDDPMLIQYYTEWLPSLMASHPTPGNLKSIQPIEWPVGSSSTGFLKRLLSGRGESNAGRDGAMRFVKALQTSQSEAMPVVMLDELVDLTTDEIDAFLRTSGLTRGQQGRMTDRLKQSDQAPAAIFDTIDAYWNEVVSIP